MTVRSLVSVLFVPLCLLPAPREVVTGTGNSVVQVKALVCANGDRIASGFLWKQADRVVTSAHVVAGCEQILVYSEYSRKPEIIATVERVLENADLALLKMRTSVAAPPLSIIGDPPPEFQEVYAFGYPLGIRKMNSTVLSVRFGGSKLKDIVPDNVRSSIIKAGSPSVETDILNLQGPLQPGSSGSPIVDSSGHLIAIADGGLELGAASASWAIPVRYLVALEQAPPKKTKYSSGSANLFGAEMQNAAQTISCGTQNLTKVRTRGFSEIASSTDSPDHLESLVITSYLEPSDFRFDIYQHLESGATVAFPAGIVLNSKEGYCKAASADGRIEYLLEVASYKDKFDLQRKTEDFEKNRIGDFSRWLGPDRISVFAQKRFDGLVFTRKGFTHTTNPANPFDTSRYDRYLFETLAAKNGYLVMLITIDNNSAIANRTRENECARSGQDKESCRDTLRSYRLWVGSVLGTELTSFTVN